MTRSHIVVLPGGGYGMLADHEGEPVAQWLRGLGVEASVFAYPVLTRHPGPVRAVRDEIRRLRAAGADRVGVLGFSAGGHAAGMAALAPDAGVGADGGAGAGTERGADAGADERGAADLAVLCYPVVSMVTPSHGGSRVNLLGASPSEELMRATSLELLVTPVSPPVFLWHTDDDESVDVVPVYRLAEALAVAGVPHAVHVYPSGPHGLGLAGGSGLPARWTDEAAAWLRDAGWLS
jgi:acetyl esterase/lipase